MKKIYRQFLFFVLLIFILPNKINASHIVGGALTYTYNGANNYTVMLKLYRDCSGIAFPANVTISVFQANGTLFAPSRNFIMPGGPIINIPAVLPPCATSPSVIPCVEERTYTLSVNLAPSPGGMHLLYALCCRNPSILNITTPGAIGETFYAFIPCYNNVWIEDFVLPNTTTVDIGPTAWTRTMGIVPPVTAQVNNGQFEIVGANNASNEWASQIIPIGAFPLGVNLSVNADRLGVMEGGDSLQIFYRLNGGPKTLFPVNGQLLGNFVTPAFATATGLIGTTIQICIRSKHNATSPASEIYLFDMVSVYNNAFVPNSNPSFNNLPPLFVCSTNTFALNQSATDLDGDVLVYSMYTPYSDAPIPTYSNNIAIMTPVTWVPAYSANSPFNSPAPSVTLNPGTGIMSGVALTNGQFVFGVKCQEWRGGVLLSETTRDYEVNTVTCPPFVPPPPVVGANTPLCVGQTLSLTASPVAGATYTWTGPNGFTSALQNPTIPAVTLLASGVYSVQAIVAGCAGLIGTVSVVVNPTPAAPVAGGTSPICAGQNINLTASLIAGATYSWTGPNTFTSNIQNPTVVGAGTVSAGVYSVNATVLGCKSPNGTVNIVVNPLPASPLAGANTPLCVGQTLSLTASPIAGATYTWTGPNAFTSALQNPTIAGVTLLAAGVYSVKATVLGCQGPNGTVNVVVNPLPAAPVAGANTPLCVGQTLNLTASPIAGATYSWTGPNAFSSALQNPSIAGVTLLAAGIYSVNATLLGCAGPNGTVSVVVNPLPAAPVAGANTPLCVGQTLSLTASPIAGATYSWTGPNAFSSAIQNPTIAGVTILANGVYSVNATVLGCAGTNGTVNVVVNPLPAAPVAGANTPLCVGQTLNLTASLIAGATYSWTGPNAFSSALQNPSLAGVTLLAAGVYSVNATVLGCAGPSGTVNVVVNPTPAAPAAGANTPLCVGQTLNLTASLIAGATYSWTGPNAFSSALQNPSIAGVTILANGVYSVNATVLGCAGANGTINVVVNPLPAAPVAGANTPLCVGQTLNLTASLIAGATYSWTGPNAFSSALQNPTIPGVTILANGVYSVNVTVLGCAGPSGTVNVVVNPLPAAPVPGSNSPVCAGQTINLTASLIAGATYSWTGPNTFTSSVQNPTIPGATILASGVYTVNATLLGCSGPSGTINVIVNPTPAAPAAGANTPLCVGQTLNLTSPLIAGASYSWTGPNAFSSALQNPTIAGVTLLANGVYSVNVTVLGCAGPSGTINVVVNPIPAAPVAGSNSPLCVGQTLNLTASAIAGASYSWNGPNTFTSTIQNPTIVGATALATGNYSVTVTVLGCAGPAGIISVTVSPPPPAPVASANTPLCSGQTLSLTAGTIVGATSYSWTGPNTFTSIVQNPNILSPTVTASGIYSVSAVVLGCVGPYGTVSVIVNPTPAAPVAGGTSPICSGQTINLTASPIAGATYNWSGPNSFTSTVQNPSIVGSTTLATGIYTVNATVAGCAGPDGTVSIVVNDTPAALVVGSNTPLCAGQTLSLTANTIAGASYSWTGPNSFTSTAQNPTIPGATTLATGVYSVNATALGCSGPFAVVSVTINAIPPAPTIVSANSPLCSGQTLSLTASTVGGATYNWNGPNSFTSTTQNPTILNVDTLATGLYSVTATVNGCTSAAGTVSVNVGYSAIVNAGLNDTVCAGALIIPLNGTVGGAATAGVWSTLGTGTFGNPNNLITTYTMSPADTLAGSVTIFLTTVGGGCGAATDTVKFVILNAPIVNAGPDQSVCKNAVISLNGLITGFTTSGQWTSTGTGTFSPNNTTLNGLYYPSSADTAQPYIKLVLETTNNKACNPRRDTVVIYFVPAPRAGFTYTTACANKPINFIDNSTPTASITTYNWNFGDGGTSISPNPTYTYSVGNTYTVTHWVVSVNGCPDTIRKVVTVYSIPVPNFNYNAACVDYKTSFFDSSYVNPGSITGWYWTFGNGGKDSLNQNPTNIYSSNNVYSVNLVVTSSNGCKNSITKVITVNPRPTANFSIDKSPTLAYATVSLTDLSTPAASIVSWWWNFGDSIPTTSLLQNPNTFYTNQGIYTLTLAVLDNKGCADTIRKDIQVTLLPAVPTAFTPNGDGVNDFLFVKGGPFVSMAFRVYNNWGELLFNTTDQKVGWDGKYKGQPVSLGVYVWILDADLYSGEHVRKTGDITILK